MNIKFAKENIIKLLFLSIIFSFFIVFKTISSNYLSSIDIDVKIHNDGSATILNTWTGNFMKDTEIYIPIIVNDLEFTNYSVKMIKPNEIIEFEYVEDWNIHASFDLKKYKYGIVKKGKEIELCFGISEYSLSNDNKYSISYDILNFVNSYNDYDGFNFQFINENMSLLTSKVNIKINFDNHYISKDNIRAWAFGFQGNLNLYDNYVLLNSYNGFQYNNYANVLLRIDKGFITPSSIVNKNFSDVKNKALDGSSYQNEYLPEFIFTSLVCIFAIFISIFAFVKTLIRRSELKKFYKNCTYFRDTPNNGNIFLSYALIKDFNIWTNKKEPNIIATLIMKMIYDKKLEAIEISDTKLFGIVDKNINLKIVSEPRNETEKELYNMIVESAGVDKVLEEKELKKFAKINYKEISKYIEKALGVGRSELNNINGYKRILGKNLNDLTEEGKKQLAELYGLRKFLLDFTLIKEREVEEVHIWENLLIYATLFGIANKVLANLKTLYYDRIDEFTYLENYITLTNVYYNALFYGQINNLNLFGSNGLGGGISLGGGGGFSGGGFGGGTR